MDGHCQKPKKYIDCQREKQGRMDGLASEHLKSLLTGLHLYIAVSSAKGE